MLQALRDPTRPDHGRAVSSLDEHVTNPSFVLIMMHVFSSGAQYQAQGLTPDLRQLAGLVIKNYVFPHLVRLPSNVQAMIKREVVRVLHDSIPDIRKTAAILAGKISESFPVATWADMMPPILQMLDLNLYASHPTVVEGSLEAVQRICEDSSLKLALDETNRPLETLIPRLLALLTCPEAGVRIGALSSYNSLLYLLSPGNYSSDSLRSRNSSFNDNSDESSGTGAGAGGEMRTFSPANISSPNSAMGNAAHPLIVHMNAFIQRLSTLATDSHPKVRTVVCQAITTISTHHVAVLDPYFNDICQFMLVALQDTEESVAIESCEFWGVLTEQADTKRAIMPFLRTLVEHLISRLYLTAEQMEQERIDEEEEDSGEKELNLRPIHHKVSSSGSSGGGGNGGGSGDSDDKENSELSAKWTLRKQAALLLDNVALSFPPHDILAAGNYALFCPIFCFAACNVFLRIHIEDFKLVLYGFCEQHVIQSLLNCGVQFIKKDNFFYVSSWHIFFSIFRTTHTNMLLGLPKIQEFFQHPNVLVKESGMLALGALSTGACILCTVQYILRISAHKLPSCECDMCT